MYLKEDPRKYRGGGEQEGKARATCKGCKQASTAAAVQVHEETLSRPLPQPLYMSVPVLVTRTKLVAELLKMGEMFSLAHGRGHASESIYG